MARNATITHLLECHLDWNTAIESRNRSDIVYLDLAKSFDSVVPTKLLAK